MSSLSPFFQKPPKLEDIFPYAEKDVLATLRRENVYPQCTSLTAPEVLKSDRWLMYAVHHAVTKFPNAESYDKFAFAGMVQGIFSGWFGGFGTDDERQERVENQTVFLANRLAELKVADDTKARIILLFLEDRYFK